MSIALEEDFYLIPEPESVASTLPVELLLKIFSELPATCLQYCSQTCSVWKNVIEDDQLLWRSIPTVFEGLPVFESAVILNQAGFPLAARVLKRQFFFSRFHREVLLNDILSAIITLHLYGHKSTALQVLQDVQRVIVKKGIGKVWRVKALWFLVWTGHYRTAFKMMNLIDEEDEVHKYFGDQISSILQGHQGEERVASILSALCASEYTKYLSKRLRQTEENNGDYFGEQGELDILLSLETCLKESVLYDPQSVNYLSFMFSPPDIARVIVESRKQINVSQNMETEYLNAMTNACCVYSYYVVSQSASLGSKFSHEKKKLLSYLRRTELISIAQKNDEMKLKLADLKIVIKNLEVKSLSGKKNAYEALEQFQ